MRDSLGFKPGIDGEFELTERGVLVREHRDVRSLGGIFEVALVKTKHPIALADCFAISTAADNDAVLFTGDPEIIAIADLPCEVRDLRPSG